MQSPTHSTSALETPLAELSHELARLVERFVPEDGVHVTAIPGLKLARATTPSLPMQTVYDPCLCIIAQGSKEIRLGDELYVYDPLNYLVASVVLPVTGRVIEASPQRPYLSLALEIDPAIMVILMTGFGTIDTAVDAMKAGAVDYIVKPFKLKSVLAILSRALARLATMAIQKAPV